MTDEVQRHREALEQSREQTRLVSEALYALHVQSMLLQAVLCAAVDAHPEPQELLVKFQRQIGRTMGGLQPGDHQLFEEHRNAWEQRILRRVVGVISKRDLTESASKPGDEAPTGYPH